MERILRKKLEDGYGKENKEIIKELFIFKNNNKNLKKKEKLR